MNGLSGKTITFGVLIIHCRIKFIHNKKVWIKQKKANYPSIFLIWKMSFRQQSHSFLDAQRQLSILKLTWLNPCDLMIRELVRLHSLMLYQDISLKTVADGTLANSLNVVTFNTCLYIFEVRTIVNSFLSKYDTFPVFHPWVPLLIRSNYQAVFWCVFLDERDHPVSKHVRMRQVKPFKLSENIMKFNSSK